MEIALDEAQSTETWYAPSTAPCARVPWAGSLHASAHHGARPLPHRYAEHRSVLEFHGQMAKIEMGGSLRAPSIAQLLDQNLLSPQEATASQNLGELVRPFTNHHNRGVPDPLAAKRAQNGPLMRVAQGKPPRKAAELGHDAGGKGGGAAGSGAPSLAGGLAARAALTSPFMLGGGVLEALDLAENGTEEDHHSSTSASELHGNSVGSSLHSSRGPTRAGVPPPLTALKARSAARRQGSREREGGNNTGRRSSNSTSPTGSARGDRSQPPTPTSSRPPSMTKAPPGPPPLGLNHRSSAGTQQPAQRVKRFRPLNRGTTPTVHVAAGGVASNRVATQAVGGLKLPIIGAGAQQQQSAGQQSVGDRGALAPALSAAQLASARAAAAVAAAASRPLPLQQKIQALNEAYGGGAGSARGGQSGGGGPQQQRRLVPPPPPPLNKGSAVVVRQGSRLPPAAPSQKWAQKLQAPHPQYPRAF